MHPFFIVASALCFCAASSRAKALTRVRRPATSLNARSKANTNWLNSTSLLRSFLTENCELTTPSPRCTTPVRGGCAITLPAVEQAVKQSGPPPRPERANAGSAPSLLPSSELRGEDASRYCPVCSQRLESRRCKLICNRCGYYMSCADYV
jgi:hypothetical protein